MKRIMKTKKIGITAIVVLLGIVLFIQLGKQEVWEANETLLKEKILSLDQSVETINIVQLTPFAWDVVYSFDPYTSKEQIYETVGYKWDRITETVSEGMNQIVFLQDGKVVCYVYGYPENNGYGLSFRSTHRREVTSASVLRVEDDVTFRIERRDGVIFLTNH